MSETLTEATEAFIKSATWLTDADKPMVTALRIMAAHLDNRMSGQLMGQYGLAYRFLAKNRPEGTEVKDPLERLLDEE